MVNLRKMFFLLIVVAAGAGRPAAGWADDNAPFCVPKKLVTMLERDQGRFLAVFATEKTSTPGKRSGDCYNRIFWSEDGVRFSALPDGVFFEGYSSTPASLAFADPVHGKEEGIYKLVRADGKDSAFRIACGKASYHLTPVSDDRMKTFEKKFKEGKLVLSYQMPKDRRIRFLLKDPESGAFYVLDEEKFRYDNTFVPAGRHFVPKALRLLVGVAGHLEEKQLQWYGSLLDGGTVSVEAAGLKISSPTLWNPTSKPEEEMEKPKVNGATVVRLDRGKNQVSDLGSLLKSIGLDPALYRRSSEWRTPCGAPQARDEAPEHRPDGDSKRAE